MKVLMVYPDFSACGDNNNRWGFYSEGLASLSAVVKEGGYEFVLYHLINPPTEEQFIEHIRKEEPNIIGFTMRTSIFPIVQKMVGWAKKATNALTIAGSWHPTLVPDEVLNTPGMDIVCVGEGEYPLLELCECLEKGKDYTKIMNLQIKQNGNIIRNPVRPLIEDLDTLPLPDFNLFDYKNLFSQHIHTAPVMLSRGCPYRCTYCCNHQLREVYPNKGMYARFRSPQKSIEYIKKIIKDYPDIRYVDFMDNILPLNKKWFFEFIDMYKKEIGLPYSCRHHPSLVDKEVVRVMKETGCYLIHFGVESGNEFILKEVLNRSVTREQIKSAFKACHDAGISVLSYNMIGLPLETLQMTLDTIKLNAEIGAERMMHPIFYPFPKTKLYDLSVEKGFIPPNLDYTKEVQLTQPQYPQEQVLFVRSYFSVFVRLYRLIFKLPPSIRKTAENIVDKFFTTKYKPHSLLVKLADKFSKMITEIKIFIRTYFPDTYLKLRDMRIKRKEKVAYYDSTGGEEQETM